MKKFEIHVVCLLPGRVTAVESLFWYATGAEYNSFQNLNWMPIFSLGTSPADASAVCGPDIQCLRVYSLTNNAAAAQATVAAAGTASTLAATLCKHANIILLFSTAAG
jgi:hypothetical protein